MTRRTDSMPLALYIPRVPGALYIVPTSEPGDGNVREVWRYGSDEKELALSAMSVEDAIDAILEVSPPTAYHVAKQQLIDL